MTCTHPTIETWRTADGVTRMWACAECHQKFVPLTRQMIDDEALLRQAKEVLFAIISDGIHCDVVPHLHRDAQTTVAAIKERLK